MKEFGTWGFQFEVFSGSRVWKCEGFHSFRSTALDFTNAHYYGHET